MIVKVHDDEERQVCFDNGERHTYHPHSLHKLKPLNVEERCARAI